MAPTLCEPQGARPLRESGLARLPNPVMKLFLPDMLILVMVMVMVGEMVLVLARVRRLTQCKGRRQTGLDGS